MWKQVSHYKGAFIRVFGYLALSLLAYYLLVPGAPLLLITNKAEDLGALSPGEIKTCNFKMRNVGRSDLVINKITTSCSCTVVNVDHLVLKPGECRDLVVHMKANDIPGKQFASILLQTNQSSTDLVKLTISAMIDPVVSIRPNIIDFNICSSNHLPAELNLLINSLFGRHLEDLTVTSNDAQIAIKMEPLLDNATAVAKVVLKSGSPIGPIDSSIIISSNGLRLIVPVVGQIIGDCHSDPNTIFWGRVNRQYGANQTLDVFGLKNNDVDILVEPEWLGKSLSFKWNSSRSLNILLKPGVPEGLIKAKLTFIKNKANVLQVPMYAIIVD